MGPVRQNPVYEYLGLLVQNGKLWPDRPVPLPEYCLGDLIEVLSSEGWEIDPEWRPADPNVTLRRQLPEVVDLEREGQPDATDQAGLHSAW